MSSFSYLPPRFTEEPLETPPEDFIPVGLVPFDFDVLDGFEIVLFELEPELLLGFEIEGLEELLVDRGLLIVRFELLLGLETDVGLFTLTGLETLFDLLVDAGFTTAGLLVTGFFSVLIASGFCLTGEVGDTVSLSCLTLVLGSFRSAEVVPPPTVVLSPQFPFGFVPLSLGFVEDPGVIVDNVCPLVALGICLLGLGPIFTKAISKIQPRKSSPLIPCSSHLLLALFLSLSFKSVID